MTTPVAVFDEIVAARPPAGVPSHIDTACVLGGSIAGLMAARVLSDHARRVVVIERDELPPVPVPKPGTPQDHHLHVMPTVGYVWLERWLPGALRDATDRGAVFGRSIITVNGHKQPGDDDVPLLLATRPLLEAVIRAQVTALPNVTILRGFARGIRTQDGAATAVTYAEHEGAGSEQVLEADFVVDAMGRSSRMPEWVAADGFDKPALERHALPVTYRTARFRRTDRPEDLDAHLVMHVFSPEKTVAGVAGTLLVTVEDDQWFMALAGYGDDRPGQGLDEFRAAAAELHPLYSRAVSGEVTREIMQHRLADSRRRDFTGLKNYPARLVSTGDSVASYNPFYGQGMGSAALQASALSLYLSGKPDLSATATEFFGLQQVVVDALWSFSTSSDAARLDALNGVEAPEEVRQARWASQQLQRAGLVDTEIAKALQAVTSALRHPATLSDPALLKRAKAVNASLDQKN